MARKASPWYWPERSGWFTIVAGKRHLLGSHPAGAAAWKKRKEKWVIPDAIDHAFHNLLDAPRSMPLAATQIGDCMSVAEVCDKCLD